MHIKAARLRLRRKWRKQQRQANAVGKQTERTLERYFFGRFHKLSQVWRPMFGWLALMLLLIGCVLAQNVALSGYYQTLQPVPGGIYSEGIVGSFTNASPLYAVSDVDQSVSRLLFAGLFTYDNHNHLVGDLAASWKVDASGKVYTVVLRPNLTWHDGQPLTASDVAFTYHTIQNPDAESPLHSSWAGITVAAPDAHTVTFTLPNPLTSFVYNLTNGIVPQHLLRNVPLNELRSVAFNTIAPVGAGPFVWHDMHITGKDPANAEETITLAPFAQYWAGAPKLRSFSLHAFTQYDDMLAAYRKHQLSAVAGLQSLPSDLKSNGNHTYIFPMSAANMVFFHTSSGIMADKSLRQALVAASDPAEIIRELGYPARPVTEPLLAGQLGFQSRFGQTTGDRTHAAQLLDADGWVQPAPGKIRVKNGQPLTFRLYAADSPENQTVTSILQQQWRQVGVNMVPVLQDADTFHDTLTGHMYDALLYGISIGVDPDVMVYWDSSQADVRSPQRLNFSEYRSTAADISLEAGRTRTGDALRKLKYEPFLQAWRDDAPALGLYQPRYIYVSREPVYGLSVHTLNTASDRYNNVHNWMVRTARVTNP